MQTITKILIFVYHAVLWAIAIAILGYLAWGLLTKPKWRKNVRTAWHNISKWAIKKARNISSKTSTKEKDVKKAKQEAPSHIYSPKSPPKDVPLSEKQIVSIESKLEGIARQLEELYNIKHHLDLLTSQVERLGQAVEELKEQPSTISATTSTPVSVKKPLTRRTYYVSAPSLINPVRFRHEDLSDHPGNHFFSIDAIDGESGEIDVVSDPDIAEKLLSTLAFQNNIVEVTEKTTGTATAIGVLEKGKLAWEDGLWRLTEKIKIKII